MPHEIRIPRLGWSMEEGVFVGWLKQPGDPVALGDPLYELESDKALQQIESIDEGLLFVVPDAPAAGATVPVGTLLGYLLAVGEAAPATSQSSGPAASTAAATTPQSAGAATNSAAGPAARRLARALDVDLASVAGTGKRGRITCEDVAARSQSTAVAVSTTKRSLKCVASPRARRVALELGVDWKSLTGTGRNGRVREADVRTARSTSKSRGIPLSPRRKAIAERLRKSRERTVPVTLHTIADATNLVVWREQFRGSEGEIMPAFTDIFASLVAKTLSRHSQMSVRWEPGQDALIPLGRDELHVAIAVDTPDGLLAPVVRCVADKSPAEIARESKLLIERARQGRVTSAEMQDAAITITNLGGYGIDAFTPVINYPEIAILGLGAIRLEPAVTRDGRIEPRQRITLSLTFDHAAVDGAPAAAFLRDVVIAIETIGVALVAHPPV